MELPSFPRELADRIEVGLLRPEATRQELESLFPLVVRQGFHGVMVQSSRVSLARHCLEESRCQITALINYPHGGSDPDVCRFEIEVAIDHGAHEVEVVLSPGLAKESPHAVLTREFRDLVEAAEERPVKLFVPLEFLDAEKVEQITLLAAEAGIAFLSLPVGNRAAAADLAELKLPEPLQLKAVCSQPQLLDALTAPSIRRIGLVALGTGHGSPPIS